ncbi:MULTISPECIES: STAS domain-containing protein [Actinosynnema]|uniref:STAS domain-containing protein n=1 Tax=Actinosynnema TaxID=40566 RepID=UPI0020A26B21|nr:STAS domain-containing protein [Actinosynnema pretiosum]MCP2092765.1 anti-anti-sigma factor [Actinosynnema pretiosum]
MTSARRTEGLKTSTRQLDGGVVVFEAVGEVDISTADDLREPLVDLAGGIAAGGVLVVDLSGIGFFSSPGIEALLVADKRVRAAGGRLRVVTSPVVRRALVAVGLRQALDMRDALDDALRG